MKKIVIVIILLLATGYFGYRSLNQGSQQPQYQTAQVEKGILVSSISASGNVAALDKDLQAKQAGAWASYLSAKNSLDSAKAKTNSLQAAAFKANQAFINDAVVRGLKTDDPTYIQENALWLQAEADYKNQSSAIIQAQAALNSAWLSYLLTATTNLEQGKLQANVNLTEIDVIKVSVDQKATLTLDAFPDKTFTGIVSAINTNGIVSSGVTTYPATITFDSVVNNIYPNMAVSAKIITNVKNEVLLVPPAAVQNTNAQTTIRMLSNGNVTSVPVEAGDSNDTQIEIKSGVNEGDIVVTGTTSSTNTRTQGGTSPFGGFGGRGGFGGGFMRR